MSVEDILNDVCEFCRDKIISVFEADPRPPAEVIAGDRLVSDCCFVADEIRFLEGRLIFEPQGTGPNEEREYCRRYFVVCRKLVIVGGGKPLSFDVCGSEDPGNAYEGRNVITWLDRLNPVSAAPPFFPAQAAQGQSFDRNAWQDMGQGNNGLDGGPGADGAAGHNGGPGRHAPDFALIALEIETVDLNAHLRIDFDGQVGGQGGRGQDGGDGGEGMGGRQGQSDNTWPGEGCDRQPGHGGDAGPGGDGGQGGQGGNGGNAGDIAVISTHENISSGPLVDGTVSYMNDGGNEGDGGGGGYGGSGGALPPRFGKAGFKTNQCDAASDGSAGADGAPAGPQLPAGSPVNQGPPGAPGASGTIEVGEIVEHECTNRIPLAPDVTSITPDAVCRGFSTPANNVDVTISGQHLAQVTGVSTNLANVAITKKITSTDTQLDLSLDIAGNSGIGSGDLILHRAFGSDVTLSGALSVGRMEVTAVNPSSGDRGEQVNVTISGTCFDPSALIQQVTVSGLGVDALNMLVVDETTIQVTFDIAGAAGLGARDVTVKTGTTHTLIGGFTVTL